MVSSRLTTRGIDAIKPPEIGRVEHWDSVVTGLGLRVSETGRKSWVVMYRNRSRELKRMTLGTYPSKPLANAREEAQDILTAAAKGGDPATERKTAKKSETFTELADAYIEQYAKPNKRSWWVDRDIIKRDLLPVFGRKRANEITRKDVIALLKGIVDRGAPSVANRTLPALRMIYSWGISTGNVDLDVNPCHEVKKPVKEHARDRVLKEAEIRAFWHGLAKASMSEYSRLALKLLLLTAQRRVEVVTARWSDIDEDTGVWTIPVEVSKNRLAHRVPLSEAAMIILDEIRRLQIKEDDERERKGKKKREPKFLLPSPRGDKPMHPAAVSHAVTKNMKVFGIDRFTPHDLRRTAASMMTSMGIPRFNVSKVLNHAEAGVTAVYDRHSYDPEKKAALDDWAVRLGEILGKES